MARPGKQAGAVADIYGELNSPSYPHDPEPWVRQPGAAVPTDPKQELRDWYSEVQRRGLFQRNQELQQWGHELRRRGLIADPTQGGAVQTRQPKVAPPVPTPQPMPRQGGVPVLPPASEAPDILPTPGGTPAPSVLPPPGKAAPASAQPRVQSAVQKPQKATPIALPQVTLSFGRLPEEDRYTQSQRAIAQIPAWMRAPGRHRAEGGPVQEAETQQRVALTQVYRKLPEIDAELKRQAQGIAQRRKELQAAIATHNAAIKSGKPSGTTKEALDAAAASLDRNQKALQTRAAQRDSYLKRWQQLGTNLKGRAVHSGQFYPEEEAARVPGVAETLFTRTMRSPVGKALSLLNPAQITTERELKEVPKARALLMLTGQYPELPPLPRGTPEQRQRLIAEKEQLRRAIWNEGVSDTKGNVNTKLLPSLLGQPLTPWQQQLLPVLTQQLKAEIKAGQMARVSQGMLLDAAANAIGIGVGGAVGRKVSSVALRKLEPFLLEAVAGTGAKALAGGTRRLLVTPLGKELMREIVRPLPTVLGGAAGGGAGGAAAAFGVELAQTGDVKKAAQAAKQTAGTTALFGAGAAGLHYAVGRSVAGLKTYRTGETEAQVEKIGNSLGQRLGLTPEETTALKGRLLDIAKAPAARKNVLREQLVQELRAGRPQPGAAEPPPPTAKAKPTAAQLKQTKAAGGVSAPAAPSRQSAAEVGLSNTADFLAPEKAAERWPGIPIGAEVTHWKTGARYRIVGITRDGEVRAVLLDAGKDDFFRGSEGQEQAIGDTADATEVTPDGVRRALGTPFETMLAEGKWKVAGSADAPPWRNRTVEEITVARDQAAASGDTATAAAAGTWLQRHQEWDAAHQVVGTPEQAQAFLKDWQKTSHPLKRQNELLTTQATRAEAKDPALATLLHEAADDAQRFFQRDWAERQGVVEGPVPVAPQVSIWRRLSPEQQSNLNAETQRALLQQDIVNSATAFGGEVPPSALKAKSVAALQQEADTLFGQAEAQLAAEVPVSAPVETPPAAAIPMQPTAPAEMPKQSPATMPVEAPSVPVTTPGAAPTTLEAPIVETTTPEAPQVSTPAYTGPERRTNLQQRKRVAEMSMEERGKALLEHSLTQLPNSRALEERKVDYQQFGFTDLDNFKWFNDTFSHTEGDKVLRAVGDAFRAAGLDADTFHISGDEFILAGQDKADIAAKLDRLSEQLAKTPIELTDADGNVVTIDGVGMSYGIGESKDAAEVGLHAHKEQRRAAGLRVERADLEAKVKAGEKPGRVAPTGGEGRVRPEAGGKRQGRKPAAKPGIRTEEIAPAPGKKAKQQVLPSPTSATIGEVLRQYETDAGFNEFGEAMPFKEYGRRLKEEGADLGTKVLLETEPNGDIGLYFDDGDGRVKNKNRLGLLMPGVERPEFRPKEYASREVPETGRKGGEVRASGVPPKPPAPPAEPPTRPEPSDADLETWETDNRPVIPAPESSLSRSVEGLREFGHILSRTYRDLPRDQYAEFQNFLTRYLRHGDAIALQQAQIHVAEILKGLSKPEQAAFERAVIRYDLRADLKQQKEEVAQGLREEVVLPEPHTEASIEKRAALSDAELKKYPKVAEAIELRRRMNRELPDKYVAKYKAVLGREPKLDREDYFHRMIIEEERKSFIGAAGSKLKAPKKAAYEKQRTGKLSAYNKTYVQPEMAWVSDMTKRMLLLDVLAETKKHDIAGSLKKAAAYLNDDKLNDELEALRTSLKAGEKPIDNPGYKKLLQMAADDVLPDTFDGQWDDAMTMLKSPPAGPPSPEMAMRLIQYLDWMLETPKDSGTGSLMYRSLLRDAARLREKAGGRKLTWEDLVPEGFAPWAMEEGNQFAPVWTAPNAMVDKAIEANLKALNVPIDALKKTFVPIGRKPMMVLPEGMAKTLAREGAPKADPNSAITLLNRFIRAPFVTYALFAPQRFIGGALRDVIGNADASVATNPDVFNGVSYGRKGVSPLHKATKELPDYLRRNKIPTPDLRVALGKGLASSHLTHIESEAVLGHLNLLEKYVEKAKENPYDAFKRWYLDKAQTPRELPEMVLRYAHYLSRLDQIKAAADGIPKNIGTSDPKVLRQIKDDTDRAWYMANQDMVPLDEASEGVRQLGQVAGPFMRWTLGNGARYFRLLQNSWRDPRISAYVGRRILTKGAKVVIGAKVSTFVLANIGAFALKAAAFVGMLEAWNRWRHPEIEKRLPPDVRGKPHLIVWADDKGHHLTLTNLGSLPDAVSWFGLDFAKKHVEDYLNGRKNVQQIATEMAMGAGNKAFSLLAPPFIVSATEAFRNRRGTPEPGQSRAIGGPVDRWLHGLSGFGFLGIAKDVKGVATGAQDIRERFAIRSLTGANSYDLGKAQYDEIRSRIRDWNQAHGRYMPEGSGDDTMFRYRAAIRFGDKKQQAELRAQLAANYKSLDSLLATVGNLSPVRGMKPMDVKAFVESLSPADQQRFREAMAWYKDAFAPGLKLTLGEKTPLWVQAIVISNVVKGAGEAETMKALGKEGETLKKLIENKAR